MEVIVRFEVKVKIAIRRKACCWVSVTNAVGRV